MNPPSIDLFLKNFSKYFSNTLTLQTRLSDLHKFIVTVLKTNFQLKVKNTKTAEYLITPHFTKKLRKVLVDF